MKEFLGGRNLPFLGLVAFALFSPISIAATNAAWVVTLLLWGYKTYHEREVPRVLFPKTELNIGFGMFLLASFLSVWTSLDFWASVVESRCLGLMVIYFLFCWNIESTAERRRLVFCLLGAAILAAIFGIVQHTTGWDYTGHYEPSSGKAGSFFGLHLTFGEYLVLTTCLVGGLVLFGNLAAPLLVAGLSVSLLMMVGIVASGSKGSLLGLITGGVVLLGLRGKKVLVWVCVVGMIAMLLIFALKSWQPLHDIVFQFQVSAEETDGPMASNTRRVYMWWSGLRISASHLLNGVGLHAVETVYPTFRHPSAKEPYQWHLHNQYIQIGVTRGLFGLAGLLYILIAAFGAGYRRFRLCQDPWDRGLSGGILAGLAGFLVCGLTEYCWGDSEVLMLVYMLLGLMVSIPVANEFKDPSRRVRQTEPVRARLSLGRIDKIVLVSMLAGVVLVSFLLPVAQGSVRMRILELALGFVLLRLVSRPEVGDDAQEVKITQAIACITVFAGYAFTRHLWMLAEEFFQAIPLSSPPFLLLVLATLVLCSVVLWVIHRKPVLSIFDVSVFAAHFMWAALALGTNLLLGLAIRHQAVLAPPLVVLLPLLTLTFSLYCLVRFSYGGDKTERILLSCVALSMLIHALR
jgi:O-antigen ligase